MSGRRDEVLQILRLFAEATIDHREPVVAHIGFVGRVLRLPWDVRSEVVIQSQGNRGESCRDECGRIKEEVIFNSLPTRAGETRDSQDLAVFVARLRGLGPFNDLSRGQTDIPEEDELIVEPFPVEITHDPNAGEARDLTEFDAELGEILAFDAPLDRSLFCTHAPRWDDMLEQSIFLRAAHPDHEIAIGTDRDRERGNAVLTICGRDASPASSADKLTHIGMGQGEPGRTVCLDDHAAGGEERPRLGRWIVMEMFLPGCLDQVGNCWRKRCGRPVFEFPLLDFSSVEDTGRIAEFFHDSLLGNVG